MIAVLQGIDTWSRIRATCQRAQAHELQYGRKPVLSRRSRPHVTAGGHPLAVRERSHSESDESIIMGTTMSRLTARGLVAAIWLAAVVSAVAGCSGSSPGASRPVAAAGSAVTIRVRSLPGVGTVLVNTSGYTLYMFEPDAQRRVTCTQQCAAVWPPVKISAGERLVAGPGVRADLLGSDPDPSGGRVVTYNRWPLYTYRSDVRPGWANGQAIDLNGGYWYVMRPSGEPLTQRSAG
jgi:predicted lipoprotein with Yx(FWY)xxD motif